MTRPENMYFIYIDESYDKTHYAYSAIFIDAFQWNNYFDKILQWRKEWYEEYGIPMDFELHATDFIGGRGEYPSNRNKTYRATLFHEAIQTIEKINDLKVINAITDNKKDSFKLFEYMLTRINTTLHKKNALGVLICDEGNENRLTAIVRRMKKENRVPPDYYHRQKGEPMRDLPLDSIIEDPLFKTSKSSYFVQIADFVAFSLLRNECPLPQTHKLVQTAFEQLDKSLLKVFRKDPKKKGIIRITKV
ncbi:MAG: DUF3800 domain-containing protein [Alphaproteobacteria bacterium]|nr:DUF3800 domain-containing protein [Alphaproteobacteria bacterium]